MALGTTEAVAAPPPTVPVQPGPFVGGTDPNAPDPGPKRNSPPTDLKNHPKRNDKPGQKPPEKAKDGQPIKDVVSIKKRPDGGTDMVIYDPAEGVTPEQLAAKLRAQGDTNVKVVSHDDAAGPAADVAALAYDPGACSYGTARTNGCPPSYWANNGYSDPQVRFNDHSSAQWPTDQAVYTWNQAVGIDSYYLWNNCPFQAGARCVDVYSGNYGDNGWAGYTYLSFVPGTTYQIAEQGNWVGLNEYPGYTNPRRTVVCQELGHALELGHNVSSSSCMWGDGRGTANLPNNDDFQMLASVYSIYR
ncbi:MAG: hypothetical protein M3Y48_12465 [Actinomycetota bacterium]|nr:hypothetical protein [Actinomycetota bacterium]